MARTVLALILVSFFATACNTMAGAGKDVSKAGDKIEGAAERNK